jgi:hypothetical protein
VEKKGKGNIENDSHAVLVMGIRAVLVVHAVVVPVAVVHAVAVIVRAVAVVLVVRHLRRMTNQLSFFSEKTDFILGNPNINSLLSYFIPFCYNVWYYESKFAHKVDESC